MSAASELLAATDEHLGLLPKPVARQLLALLDVSGRPAARETAARVVEALVPSQGTERLLTGLSEMALRLLERFALAETLPARRTSPRWDLRAGAGLPQAEFGQGLAELEARGLLLTREAPPWLLPPLRAPLVERALTQSLLALAPTPGGRPPFALQLALVAAQYADAPPLTREGVLHARASERIARALERGQGLPLNPAFAEMVLRSLGVLVPHERDGRTFLHLHAPVLLELLRLPASEMVRACLASPAVTGTLLRVLAQVHAAEARLAPGVPREVPFHVLLETLVPHPREGGGVDWDAPPPDALDLRNALSGLGTLGLVGTCQAAAPHTICSREPEPHGEGRFVVQDSLDVLLPWDAPPARVGALACFAELVSFDRVVTLRLTQASVSRGLQHLGPTLDLLALLAEGAASPMRQNVQATLEGWIRRHRPLRAMTGTFVLQPDPEQRALLLRSCPSAEEVVPGVWRLEEDGLSLLRQAARKAGVPLEVGGEGGEVELRSWHVLRPAEAVARQRALLDRLRTAPVPERLRKDTGRVVRRGGERAARSGSWPRDRDGALDPSLDAGWDAEEDGEQEAHDPRYDAPAEPGPSGRRLLTEAELIALLRGGSAVAPPGGPALPSAPRATHPLPPRDAASAAGPSETTWSNPLPGVVRERVSAAIEVGAVLHVLYRNSSARLVERRVLPLRIVQGPKGEYVEAHDQERGAACLLALERITAMAR